MLAVLPIQVLDRELDLSLFNAVLFALKGNISLIGDENNIEPVLRGSKNLFVVKHFSPTANPRRKKWNESVLTNGGVNIGYNLEGCNNSSCYRVEDPVDSSKFSLHPSKQSSVTGDLNLDMFNNQVSLMTYQSSFSFQHEKLGLPFLNNYSSRQYKITGDPRDVLTTTIGSKIFHNRSKSILSFLSCPFVLIPDNFSVDSFGMHGHGVIDPTADLLKAGNDSSSVENYTVHLKEKLRKESKGREGFARLIEKLVIELPDTLFVIRPHPVLDPSYWHSRFSCFRNVIVIYRDSIYPWLHSASAILHCGCTTGYESARLDANVIDVTSFIGHDKQSLSSLVSFQPSSYSDIKNFITSRINSKSIPSLSSDNSLNSDFESLRPDTNLSISGSIVNYLRKPLDDSYDVVRNRCSSLTNFEEIFSRNIFFDEVLRRCPYNIAPTYDDFVSTAEDLRSLVNNNRPVYLKSRTLHYQDLHNRVNSILIALNLRHQFKPILLKIASNTFLLSLKTLQPNSRVHKTFSSSPRSLDSLPSRKSLQLQNIAKFKKFATSPWPQSSALEHLKHSLDLHDSIHNVISGSNLPFASQSFLKLFKRSDTLFILGSSPSINNLSSNDFDLFKQYDSISINNFIVHDFLPTYFLYEASTDYHVDFLSRVLPSKSSDIPLILNSRHAIPILDLCSNFTDVRENIFFLNSLVSQSFSRELFSEFLLLSLKVRPLAPIHARGSVSLAYSLATLLGYKNIVFVGFELDSNEYFFQNGTSFNCSASYSMPLDKLMRDEQEFASRSFNLQSPLFSNKHKHFTMSSSTTSTLDILMVLRLMINWSAVNFGTSSYTYKPSGLFGKEFSDLPVFSA